MVTAVLLNYKRPDELKQVIEHLKTISFIDEILVHDNSGESNIINYGRYVQAKKAKNDIIYTQDDDCIIYNIKQIYDNYDGTKLVNGLKAERMKSYTGNTSMAGWGMFFDKSWVDCLDRYTDVYGEDYTFYRETDRIFTGLVEVQRLTVEADVVDFPSATNKFALYRQFDHNTYKQEAIERVNEIIASTT